MARFGGLLRLCDSPSKVRGNLIWNDPFWIPVVLGIMRDSAVAYQVEPGRDIRILILKLGIIKVNISKAL